MIPEAAVEAAARAEYEHQFLMLEGTWGEATKEVQALFRQGASVALEAAAPHMLAGVTALANAWEARGEHDMEVAKTIKDEYIASEILGHGAQMVENARHIRNATGTTP